MRHLVIENRNILSILSKKININIWPKAFLENVIKWTKYQQEKTNEETKMHKLKKFSVQNRINWKTSYFWQTNILKGKGK